MADPSRLASQLTDAELALTVLEAEEYLAQVDAGVIPPDARRSATRAELTAAVRFAALDAGHDDAAGRLMRTVRDTRNAALDGLREYVDAFTPIAAGGADVAAELRLLATATDGATLPGIEAVLADSRDAIRGELEAAAAAGREGLLAEAADQGIPAPFLHRPPLDPASVALLDSTADSLARAPVDHVTRVAADAVTPAVAAGTAQAAGYAAVDAAETASTAGLEDAARQAAGAGYGAGRKAGIAGVTARPAYVYASELLDKRTCGPCAAIDGTNYSSLDEALGSYPNAQGFADCAGGGRCRGTLVLVWDTEAPPTATGPAPTSPPPFDVTPPGAPGPEPRPPEYHGPAALLPRLPPPATPPAPENTGRTPQGIDVPAADVDTLAMTDVEVERAMEDAVTAGDYEAGERWALESDYRAGWRTANAVEERGVLRPPPTYDPAFDPRVDPVTLEELRARVSAEAADLERYYQEAREAGIDVDGTGTPDVIGGVAGGRAKDRVKALYDDYLYTMAQDAENACNGFVIDPHRRAEFSEKYGNSIESLFAGPARTGYYYASDDLVAYWREHPRLSLDEFYVQNGIRDAKVRKRAEAAMKARQSGEAAAERRRYLRRQGAPEPKRRPRRSRADDTRRKRELEQARGDTPGPSSTP